MFGRQPRLLVDVVMGITLEDDNEDFIKRSSEQHVVLLPEKSEKLDRNKRSTMTKVKPRKHQIS